MEQEKLALKTALNLINRRWYSISQITEKLQIKGFTPETITKTINFLKEKDFLNDVRFAKAHIKDRLNFRPKAKYYIDQELKLKGISKEDIESAWEQINEEIQPDELAIVTDLAKKKLLSLSTTNYQLLTTADKRRLIGYLARRGYSYDVIKKSLAILQQDS